jgi:hypothetical protein
VRLDQGYVLLGTQTGLNLIDAQGDVSNIDLGVSAQDAVMVDDQIIALVQANLVVIDRQNHQVVGRYDTQLLKPASSLLPQEMPRSITRVGQRILIAHGTLGVNIFDLGSLHIGSSIDINRGQKIKGMAQDLMVQDDDILVLVDNYQMNPLKPSQEFRGILKLDLNANAIVEKFGGLDPGATAAALLADTMLVSFSGMPIWKLQLPFSIASPLSTVAHPVTDFGIDGHSVGHLSIDNQFVWTCHRPSNKGPNIPALYPRSKVGL